MSIPNEALQKLLHEIEQKAAFAQQQIQIVKAQIAAKTRESRMLQLTSNEVSSLPSSTPVFEGVGKMFILSDRKDVNQRLSAEGKELKSDVTNLEKKLHYLETTYKNSKEHLEQVFRSGART